MKSYPRGLNRFILGILGLLMVALGAGVLTITLWPKAKEWWQLHSKIFVENYGAIASHYTLAGGVKLFPVLWITVGILLSLFALVVIFSQGGGRRIAIMKQDSVAGKGKTRVDVSMIEPLLQAMSTKNRWIAHCSVDAWSVKGKPALLISLQCYKGADVAKVKEYAAKMVNRVDNVLGAELPVQVRITSGWHTTFSSPDRVR